MEVGESLPFSGAINAALYVFFSAGKCIQDGVLCSRQLWDGCKVKEEPFHHVPCGIQIPGNLSDIQVVRMAVPALALQPPCLRLLPTVARVPLSVQHRLHLGFSVCLVVGWVFLWLLFLQQSIWEHLSQISQQDAVPFAYKTQELNLTVCVPCDLSCGPQFRCAVQWDVF